MKKFEYQIRAYPMDKKTSLADLQDDLNRCGASGWEVVSVSTSEFAHIGHTVFLKREVSQDSDNGEPS